MKKSLVFLFVVFGCSLSLGQFDNQTRDSLIGFYEEIIALDQSSLNDTTVRNGYFRRNFALILNEIEVNRGPILIKSKMDKRLKAKMNMAIQSTFLHILQTQPKLLLNEDAIETVKLELDRGLLSITTLKFVLSAFQYDLDVNRPGLIWDTEIEDNFYLALRTWGIKLYDTE